MNAGDVWTLEMAGLPGFGMAYGYRVSGQGGWDTGQRWDASKVLLDPYAPLVQGRRRWATRDAREQFKGKVGEAQPCWARYSPATTAGVAVACSKAESRACAGMQRAHPSGAGLPRGCRAP